MATLRVVWCDAATRSARRGRPRRTCGLHVVESDQSLVEATGVRLLSARQRLEPLGDLLEALVARGASEARVHLGVLVGLGLDGALEVLLRVADRNAGDRVADLLEELEVTEGVSRLTFGDVAEQAGHVGIALDVGAAREVQVTAVRLRFAGERLLEVALGLAALQRSHSVMPPLACSFPLLVLVMSCSCGCQSESGPSTRHRSHTPRACTCSASTR